MTEPADPIDAGAGRPADLTFEKPAVSSKWARQRRAVMALEYAATPEATRILQLLAGAASLEPRLAGEARVALARLNGPP